jgi:hypothetical protein
MDARFVLHPIFLSSSLPAIPSDDRRVLRVVYNESIKVRWPKKFEKDTFHDLACTYRRFFILEPRNSLPDINNARGVHRYRWQCADRRPGSGETGYGFFFDHVLADSEEDGSIGGSGDEGQHEEGHDEVEILEETTSIDTNKPILCFPERNDPDTGWTRDDDTFPACGKNKMKTDDMETVRQRKELCPKKWRKKKLGLFLTDGYMTKSNLRWNNNTVVFPQ